MNAPPARKRLLCLAVLLTAVSAAGAQNIYKCSNNGRLEYTDRPCPGGRGELIHQADDSEIIDQYLRLDQDTLARRYADSRHLQVLYKERVAAHQRDLDEDARHREQAAIAAQRRDEQARQQAQADEAAQRDQLQVENDTLRQQNEQYRDQLAQPAHQYLPGYWGVAPIPLWSRDRNRDHDRHRGEPGRGGSHDDDHGRDRAHAARPRTDQPMSHPCTQLAGGRVQC